MGYLRVISTVDALRGSHASQHSSQLFYSQQVRLFPKFLFLLDSPYRMPVGKLEQNQKFFLNSHRSCDKKLEAVLTGMEDTQSICGRDKTKIAHISAGIVLWT
jgi:hypothetical protein